MDLDQSLNSEEDPDPSNANLNGDSENTLCLCLTTEHRCRRRHLKFAMKKIQEVFGGDFQ